VTAVRADDSGDRRDATPATPRGQQPGSQAGLGVDGSAQSAESGYCPNDSPEPDDALEVRVELLVLDGSEGRVLGQRQADVMRKVLRWIAFNRDTSSW